MIERETDPFTPQDPQAPIRGDRFRVEGRAEPLIFELVELSLSRRARPTRWVVRTAAGARWALVVRDGSEDGCWYLGTPLPADPDAPEA
jgi:hypothetical protein